MKCWREAVIRIANGLRRKLPDFPAAGTAMLGPGLQSPVTAPLESRVEGQV